MILSRRTIFAAVFCTAVLFCALLAVWLLRKNSAPANDAGVLAPAPTEASYLVESAEFFRIARAFSTSAPDGYFFPRIMCPGSGLLDFDQDGDLDILLVTAGPDDSSQTAPSPACRMLRQDTGLKFVDITATSGLDVPGIAMGVAVGDVNNDGYPDVWLACVGADRLFLNRSGVSFEELADDGPFDDAFWSTSCSFFDYDRDGWLDLFVANYVDYQTTQKCINPAGHPDYCNPKLFPGTPARIYHNEKGNRFRDVTVDSRIATKPGPGLGVLCTDFNGDRWPDIFVANDGAANFLWINQQDGTYREEAVERGVAYDGRGRPQANMGIAHGDLDNDGGFDLLITHLDGEFNALYSTRPNFTFDETAESVGLGSPSFSFTGFGAAFVDIDHDGDLDLAVVNGRVRRPDGVGAPRPGASGEEFWRPYAERNQLFLNEGNGQFIELTTASEAFFNEPMVGRGLACGDIDNDGDVDFLVTRADGTARLYLNVAPKTGHWLMVRAVEPRYGGRDAYCAVVKVVAGERHWARLIQPGSSYLVSHDPRAHFGLGVATEYSRIEIAWPDGTTEVFPGGTTDHFITLRHGEGQPP